MRKAGGSRRSAASSRCTCPRDLPLTWIDYVDESDPAVVELVTWLAALTPSAQTELVSRIDALRERASRGEIEVPQDNAPGDLDAIRSDPDLYELRWTLYTKLVRQYHGEPPGCPNHLVALHMHIKADRTKKDALAGKRQQVAIDKAAERYHDGESTRWGEA